MDGRNPCTVKPNRRRRATRPRIERLSRTRCHDENLSSRHKNGCHVSGSHLLRVPQPLGSASILPPTLIRPQLIQILAVMSAICGACHQKRSGLPTPTNHHDGLRSKSWRSVEGILPVKLPSAKTCLHAVHESMSKSRAYHRGWSDGITKEIHA